MPNSIHTPEIVSIDEHGGSSATFVIAPLHSGYGMTLGNSLRRVLLSSIAGAAITSLRIEGVSHEFTTIPGVREDVIDIMLNLKQVRFRLFREEPQQLRINKKGGVISAGDITLNSDVEVVNPEQVIATIDDDQASVAMGITVEVGRGYQVAEESADKTTADAIALDAAFGPVQRVRYKVGNTRVGQITNLDRLELTVDTDGSISPKDALEEAAAILVSQYQALAGKVRLAAPEASSAHPSADSQSQAAGYQDAETAEEVPALMTSVEDMGLSARTTNALINNDIHTIGDLFALTDAELRDLKGFGSKALDEVKDKLAETEL